PALSSTAAETPHMWRHRHRAHVPAGRNAGNLHSDRRNRPWSPGRGTSQLSPCFQVSAAHQNDTGEGPCMSLTPYGPRPLACSRSSIAGLVSHHPVFLRREAAAVGIDDGALRRAVRDGALVRVRQGIYADGKWWREADAAAAHAGTARAA